ncbi:MAG: diguanylate cyclase (GGDEF)-like protein [Cocleimonas sp.]|jgi:diguanylate cyclase (GGDEF)-like protein
MSIAAIAQYIRDSLIYKNLLLQKDLKSIVDEKMQEAKKQKRLANIDVLTGIPNRRYIIKKLQKIITEIERSESQLTLIFIDLNGFKGINDNYGHDSGDKVLEVTAKRLQQTIRDSDYLARLGGDEFLLGFKTEKHSETFIKNISDNIKTIVSAPIAFKGNILKVGLSLGCAHYPADGKCIEELIKVADANMYSDKQNSKKRRIASVSNISA